MKRGDLYPYDLVGKPIYGFSLAMLSNTHAFPARVQDATTIRSLILADESGDYPTYFPVGATVTIKMLSVYPVNDPDFSDIVDEWKDTGWTLLVFNAERGVLETWDPTNLHAYGVRQ